jgi:nitrous oxide reductase accessory protein NosL
MAALGMVLALPACGEAETGPEPVHWDRDACELCRMLISDPRFAAEIRGPDNRLHKFDDPGDAIHWLEAREWKDDPKVGFWVAGLDSTREKVNWLDAREAWYVSGQETPMNYGWGAVADKVEGAVPFAEMKRQVIERGCTSSCTAAQGEPAAPNGAASEAPPAGDRAQ